MQHLLEHNDSHSHETVKLEHSHGECKNKAAVKSTSPDSFAENIEETKELGGH